MIETIADLKAAINKVLDYNWSDEEDDYNDHGGDCEENENHIYRTLLDLDRWANEE